jgi:hypothetical protein
MFVSKNRPNYSTECDFGCYPLNNIREGADQVLLKLVGESFALVPLKLGESFLSTGEYISTE